MIIRYHEPLGEITLLGSRLLYKTPLKFASYNYYRRHPCLKKGWQERMREADSKPKNLGKVAEHVYRSEIIWPCQIPNLQEEYGLQLNIIQLMEASELNFLFEAYPEITIHQMPFRRSSAMTPAVVVYMVHIINSFFPTPTFITCDRGTTRTGILSAGVQIVNELMTSEDALDAGKQYWSGKNGWTMHTNRAYIKTIRQIQKIIP